jgi:hypothetical protein
MIIPTLDLERTGGKSDAALIAWVKAWVGRVYERLGVKPMIYASPSFWASYMGNTSWFADNGTTSCGSPIGARPARASPAPTGAASRGRSGSTPARASSRHQRPGRLDRYRLNSFDAVTIGGG